jgi:transposase-like protein
LNQDVDCSLPAFFFSDNEKRKVWFCRCKIGVMHSCLLHRLKCPHCQGKSIRGNGKLKGVQRYVCKSCAKNFSETTGKFWFALKKKDKVRTYLYCLLSGYSIRKSAKETGISVQTSFDWRHKLLTGFSVVSPAGFEGIVESDDLFFLHSEKGKRHLDRKPRQRGGKAGKPGISNEQVAVIATCDRSGHKDFKVATQGRVSKKDIEKVLKLHRLKFNRHVFCMNGIW